MNMHSPLITSKINRHSTCCVNFYDYAIIMFMVYFQGVAAILDICSKCTLNLSLRISLFPITYFSVVQSVWNLHGTRQCPVQNSQTIWQLTYVLLKNEIWGCFNIKCLFTRIRIPMLKIRRSRDRLIFNMGIPIPGRISYIAASPWITLYNTCLIIRTVHVN